MCMLVLWLRSPCSSYRYVYMSQIKLNRGIPIPFALYKPHTSVHIYIALPEGTWEGTPVGVSCPTTREEAGLGGCGGKMEDER